MSDSTKIANNFNANSKSPEDVIDETLCEAGLNSTDDINPTQPKTPAPRPESWLDKVLDQMMD